MNFVVNYSFGDLYGVRIAICDVECWSKLIDWNIKVQESDWHTRIRDYQISLSESI